MTINIILQLIQIAKQTLLLQLAVLSFVFRVIKHCIVLSLLRR